MGDFLSFSTQKPLIENVVSFIDNQKVFFPNMLVYIFGAGVRGILLEKVLRKRGFSIRGFVDNDPDKWGKRIEDIPIFSLETTLNCTDVYYVISVLYSEEIYSQLITLGVHREHIIIFETNQEEKIIDECIRTCDNDYCFLGETKLQEVGLEECNQTSIAEYLIKEFKRDKARVVSAPAMGVFPMSYILNAIQSLHGMPECVCIFFDFEILTPVHHLLPRAQYAKLVLRLAEFLRQEDKEQFIEYSTLSEQKEENWILENEYSPRRTKESLTEAQKEYLEKSFLFPWSEEIETVKCLVNLVEKVSFIGKKSIVVLLPINYELCEELFPNEFSKIYKYKIEKLREQILQKRSRVLDLSFILKRECFPKGDVTTSSMIYCDGRKKIAELVIKYIKEVEKMENKILELLEEVNPYAEITKDTDLIEEGILDSTSLLVLLSEIEDEYDVRVPIDSIEIDDIRNVGVIAALVERLL